MKRILNGAGIWGLIAVCLMAGACAAIPRIDVSYVMVSGGIVSEKGSSIGLSVEDARTVRNILGPVAATEFRGNLETASLKVGEPFGELAPAGIFDVPGLFREAFRRKLEASGLKPVMGTPGQIPGLVVVVREFILDVDGRDWVGRMAYDVKLMVDGEMKFSRTVEGSARRLKLLGRSEAETLIGDLFTDCINRLDLPRFFDLAGIVLH